MNINTVNKYIPPRMKAQGGRTIQAIHAHFVDGKISKDAAKLAGISDAAASVAISRVRKIVEDAGYTKVIDYRKLKVRGE